MEKFGKCPVCGNISLLLTDSGIGNFKKGGTCAIARCNSCSYQAII